MPLEARFFRDIFTQPISVCSVKPLSMIFVTSLRATNKHLNLRFSMQMLCNAHSCHILPFSSICNASVSSRPSHYSTPTTVNAEWIGHQAMTKYCKAQYYPVLQPRAVSQSVTVLLPTVQSPLLYIAGHHNKEPNKEMHQP